jgi:16S rRNA (cytosine1402-N4)-methyltransferase
MRFDPDSPVTAAQLVRRLPEAELARIFREGGEERWANRIARVITASRQKSPITTTAQLQQIIAASLPAAARAAKIDPATRAFQALRIAVNDEAAALTPGFEAAIARTRTGGHIVVLSYHSNEDGVTKGTFRRYARKCQCPPLLPTCQCAGRPILKLLTRKPLSPSPEEVASNPRSRSAKLRAAEKL